MKTFAYSVALLLLTPWACSVDSKGHHFGTAGMAGTAGSSATAGRGGSAGSGQAGGQAGAGHTGGAVSTAGQLGTAGTSTGGSSSEGGAPSGTGGATNAGGTSDAGANDGGSGGEPVTETVCPATQHNCGGTCVSNTSVDHCGSRCDACPTPASGTATCDGTSCDFTCGALKKCGTICTAGCCSNTDCQAQAGKAGQCDTSTNTCRYDCASGYKPCGTDKCIPVGDCCSEADCAGVCKTCSGGACVAVKSADDTDSCAGTCDASGVCKSKRGQTCQTTANGCVGGSVCAPDGYCCDTACSESCQACDIKGFEGTCTAVNSGAPHGNRSSCGSDATCGGTCTGRSDGKCTYPTSNCGAGPTCSGTSAVGQGKCSSGSCVVPAPVPCSSGFSCAAGACKTTCAADSDCVSGYFCQASKCHIAATQVSVGWSFACALLADGTVQCWGASGFGQLGPQSPATPSNYPYSNVPIKVTGLGTVKAISTGADHACALLSTGAVSCWGAGSRGQLGHTNLTSGTYSATPTTVAGLPAGVTKVACGANVSCALVGSTGAMYCWGDNIYKTLGSGAPAADQSATPVKISGLGAATSISAGTATCALVSNLPYCWGNNGDAQAGQVRENNWSFPTPTLVSGVTGRNSASAISTGDYVSCAILDSGSVYCWGWNSYGELGNTVTADGGWATSATAVQGLQSGALAITSGYMRTCALLTTGKLWCWGLQRHGGLGDGVSAEDGFSRAPVQVMNLSAVSNASIGGYSGCAVLQNGSVQCWGSGNAGMLGNGAVADSSVPVPVTGW